MSLDAADSASRKDIWRERKWLDLWSVVHFLSGISIGLGAYFFNFGAWPTVIIVLLGLIAYEMWEVIVKIEEQPTNRFMDVVVGMVTFLPTFFYLSPIFSRVELMFTFVIVLLVNVSAGAIGWRESQKANELEKRMRERYAKQRARLIRRRARIRARLEK